MSFAVGVLPVAKTDEWRQFCDSIAGGERAGDHREYLRRHGVTREHILLQSTPMGDLAILVWEGVDQAQMEKSVGELMTAPANEYEEYLVNSVVTELHGLPQGAPPPPPMVRVATIDT